MERDKVSIIIRTKNEESWISLCLEKIFEQKYSNKEIIIVDNNSLDGTIQRAKQFNVKIIKLKKFFPGKAINQGIKEANGKYIMLLNSDDWLNDSAIKIIAKKVALSKKKYSYIYF